MARISAAAQQEIQNLLVHWWMAVNAQIAAATGATVQLGEAPIDVLLTSDIGQRLVRIAEIAEAIQAAESNKKIYRWSERIAAQALEDCSVVENWLNQGQKTPEAFWSSPVGFMILCAKVWANQDQLITLSAAAEISGMSLSVLSQRMARGQLPGYRHPGIKNPRHNRRVRLSELHALIDENSDRIAFPPPALVHQAAHPPATAYPGSN